MAHAFPITITGGARTGWVHSSWPFARLTIWEDTLQLNAHLREYVFSAHEPLDIRVERHWLFGVAIGVRIIHSQAETPPVIVFWTFRVGRITALLGETPFEVSG